MRVIRIVKLTMAALLGAAALCLVAILVMRVSMAPYIYASLGDVPDAEAALILGASVVQGKPSPILALRANAAVALYNAGKVKKILVSGDDSSSDYNEVTPVRKYLTDAGIPDSDIFLDHAGLDTYSSMYRARDVFQADSITIVTQDFHMPRAIFTARLLGLTAYGYIAPGADEAGNDYLREIPASLKALRDLVSRRIPEHLGAPIPLTGIGTSTWY